MELRVELANGTLDLPPNADEDFYITKQVHDLHDLETREGDFTKTLILPYSNNNIALLNDNIPSRTRHSNTGTQFIPCEVLLGGIPVITDPVMRIEKGDDNGFEVTFFSGTVDFFTQLSDDPISELNWLDLNFEWTTPNVIARANNLTGLVYPDCNWLSNESYRITQAEIPTAPSESLADMWLGKSGFWIYCKEILDRIFANLVGLTVDYTPLGTATIFDRIAIANNMTLLYDRLKEPVGFSGIAAIAVEYNANGSDPKVPMVASIESNIAFTNNEWIVVAGGTMLATFQGIYGTSGLFNQFDGGSISIMKNDTVMRILNLPAGATKNNTFFDISNTVVVVAGDRIWARCELLNGNLPEQLGGNNIRIQTTSSSFRVRAGASDNNSINVADYMPMISQRDFVRGIFNKYNIIASEKNKIISLSYWDNIAVQPSIEANLDVDKELVESGIFDGYAPRNRMRYTGSLLVERTDQNGEFAVNVASEQEQIEKVLLPFIACDDSEINAEPVASIPAYRVVRELGAGVYSMPTGTTFSTTEAHGLKVGDQVYTPIDTGLRDVLEVTSSTTGVVTGNVQTTDANWRSVKKIGIEPPPIQIAEMITGTGRMRVFSVDGFTEVFGGFRAAHFSTVMNWNSLIETYYNNLVSSLQSPYTLEAWFDIPITQFVEINQLRPLYVPSLAATFYINRIEQYKPDTLVRMELVQIGATSVVTPSILHLQGAFSSAFSNDFNNFSENEN